ncbi:MAG: DUF1493 family protein [Burkholderiales bacterium]|nr:DUF1493 family protein [Phycisphaerae bacterium]
MSVHDDLLAEIVELVKSHTGVSTVTANTRLYSDLGMTGDDADAFMKAFAVKYGPDLGGLNWQRYFDHEPGTSDMLEPALVLAASMLRPSFAVRWHAARNAKRDITVAHLADVARAKVWRDPDESFRRDPKSQPLTLIFSVISLVTMAFFVLLGGVVIYAFLAGELGNQTPLVLVGIVAMGLLPIYFAVVSWRQIQTKLDLAPRD